MTQPYRFSMRALLGACAVLAATTQAQAQAQRSNESTDANVPPATARKQAREMAQGDPARWFRDNAGMGARLRNLQQEIGAGLQEAQGACRQMAAAERARCSKDARATYQQDMAGARARVMEEFGH
jgi:hypothetical protein